MPPIRHRTPFHALLRHIRWQLLLTTVFSCLTTSAADHADFGTGSKPRSDYDDTSLLQMKSAVQPANNRNGPQYDLKPEFKAPSVNRAGPELKLDIKHWGRFEDQVGGASQMPSGFLDWGFHTGLRENPTGDIMPSYLQPFKRYADPDAYTLQGAPFNSLHHMDKPPNVADVKRLPVLFPEFTSMQNNEEELPGLAEELPGLGRLPKRIVQGLDSSVKHTETPEEAAARRTAAQQASEHRRMATENRVEEKNAIALEQALSTATADSLPFKIKEKREVEETRLREEYERRLSGEWQLEADRETAEQEQQISELQQTSAASIFDPPPPAPAPAPEPARAPPQLQFDGMEQLAMKEEYKPEDREGMHIITAGLQTMNNWFTVRAEMKKKGLDPMDHPMFPY